MSTLKQIEANRLNSNKSPGPRTTEGKSAVRLNALTHGLFAIDPVIPGEDPADFKALASSHNDRFQPATPEERFLVAAMVRDAWSLKRFSNAETALWTQAFNRRENDEHRLARIQTGNYKNLMYLQRRIHSVQRSYRRNLELLIKLQARRKKAAPAPVPIPQLKSTERVAPENGFVRANPAGAVACVTLPIPGCKSLPEPPPEAA